MTGNQEQRLRKLIHGAELVGIDAELAQWKNAKEKLYDVGAALIAVSTPVSDNLGADTVKSALSAFKQVGEKVNDRAEDIEKIHDALQSAVTATRNAQTVVTDMDGDQRQKPEFPPSKPGDDEADEIHHLKVYSGQMHVYDAWSQAREAKAREQAEKVEKAWLEAIAVMQQIPDDQKAGGSGGGGGDTGPTGPILPTVPTTPTSPTIPTVPDDPHWEPPEVPHPHDPPHDDPPGWPDPPDDPPPVPPTPHYPIPPPDAPGGHETPTHLDPYPGGTLYGPPGSTVPTGVVAPTPAVGPGSLSGYAVGGAVGAGALGGLAAGLRAAGLSGAAGGLRSGGILGATSRAAGSARGSLGSRSGMAGGVATGGTGRGGSRGSAGRRSAGVGVAGGGRGKDKDKKKRRSATVELFDEDRDWIDDEGASSGVID